VPTSHDVSPDGPLTPQQQTLADSLSPDFVTKVDAALLSHARTKNRKVAMLVGMTMGDPSLRMPGLPDVFYAQRVRALVAKRLLIAEGNLDYMIYSEVRLP
jgi:hypothetical protein